jgi:OOP family OmpA-OmpF porin
MRVSGALLWSTATAAIMVIACGREGVLSGRVSGLEKILETAEKNGAIRCAPRELAIARAHLQFAKLDVEQGQLGSAEEHLRFAEPNAQSALSLSPAEQCGGEVERPGDRDGDGLVDNLDKCPEHPERYNGHKDDDGCPDDIDTDGDGVPDSVDNCPLDPEDKDGYLDEDGCPEPDNDLDGVPDALDRKGGPCL